MEPHFELKKCHTIDLMRFFAVFNTQMALQFYLTKPISWGTAKIVVLDSGFCVLKGLIELRKKGIFVAALIKKHCYWPKYIPGDKIIEHFKNKEVGDVNALAGMLDDVPFHVFGMKEADYVMQLMSTG